VKGLCAGVRSPRPRAGREREASGQNVHLSVPHAHGRDY